MAIFRRLRERCDTILLGRVNYEGFFGYWPQVKDDPKASRDDVEISRWLDDVPKVVFSRTLREVTWKNARLAKGSAAEEVAALKRAPGKDILIQNSTRLARACSRRAWSTSSTSRSRPWWWAKAARCSPGSSKESISARPS